MVLLTLSLQRQFYYESYRVHLLVYKVHPPPRPISHQEHGKFCPEAFGKVERT